MTCWIQYKLLICSTKKEKVYDKLYKDAGPKCGIDIFGNDYRRVDIGFSYQVIKENKPLPSAHPLRFMKSLWISAEIFNLLDVNNVVSYLWLKDITNRQYAIPNYLTQRLINIRLVSKF